MRKFILILSIFILLGQHSSFAQFQRIIPAYANVANNNYTFPMMREGKVGLGFGVNTPTFNNADPLNRTMLTVNNGLLTHWVNGTIGNLDNAKWCGLGIGNPGGAPNPYGLAIAENNNVGFYNILLNDLIAGFGSATTQASNRFRIRSYNNASTNPLDFRDLLIANPNGAVGINAEPVASLYVNSVNTINPGFPNPIFKAIAIEGAQIIDQFSTASALGNQQNSSLVADEVLVEGVRSQAPNFASYVTGQEGVGVNLQAVRFDDQPNSAIQQINNDFSYAELAWQNLAFDQDVTTDPSQQQFRPVFFHISFRNGRAGVSTNNSFSNRNKLPVATFTPMGRVGIGTTVPNEFSGINPVFLDVNGGALIGGVFYPSDARYKKDINPINDALAKVRQLQGTTYLMKQEEFPQKNFMKGLQYGYIAQELEKVMPELAAKGSDGYYSVNYTSLIPVLSEAIKELDAEVTNLKAELVAKNSEFEKLNEEISALRDEMKTLLGGTSSLGTKKGFELFQNMPNPSAGTTTIGYSMPIESNFSNASINVYDLTGKMLQSVSVSTKHGEVRLDVSSLPSGTYLYDLLVDGAQIDQKKMVVVKY